MQTEDEQQPVRHRPQYGRDAEVLRDPLARNAPGIRTAPRRVDSVSQPDCVTNPKGYVTKTVSKCPTACDILTDLRLARRHERARKGAGRG